MKPNIKYLLLAAMLLIAIHTFTIYMMFKTHRINEQIKIELGTLRQVLHRYESIQLRYDTAYHRLVHTRKKLVELETLYNNQHMAQQSELQHIFNQLQELSDDKSVLRPLEIQSIDSLSFSP